MKKDIKKRLWNKDFTLLLQAGAVSTIGDIMYSVAIGYWVLEQTGSNSLMGVMTSISMFVTMFLSPFAGSIVDKCNRKWVIVLTDLLQSGVMITVGVLAFLGNLSVPIVLLAAFLAAFAGVFYSPAANTLLIDIIPQDDMVRGQSIFSGMNTTINMVGSAFSGLMVAFLGVPLIVVINGLSNLYSAISELFINVPKTVQQGETVTVKSTLKDMSVAIKTIFKEPCLKIFVPSALIINLLGAGPISLMLPFCLEKGFSVDMYGYLISVWTASSLVCVILLGAIKLKPKVRFWLMAMGFSLSCICLTIGYLQKSFLAICICAALGAFLNTAGNTIFGASMMLALPETNRSAILGFFQSASIGGTALSTLIYGVLGDIFPLYISFAVGSIISLAPMLFLSFHKRTKEFVLSH